MKPITDEMVRHEKFYGAKRNVEEGLDRVPLTVEHRNYFERLIEEMYDLFKEANK